MQALFGDVRASYNNSMVELTPVVKESDTNTAPEVGNPKPVSVFGFNVDDLVWCLQAKNDSLASGVAVEFQYDGSVVISEQDLSDPGYYDEDWADDDFKELACVHVRAQEIDALTSWLEQLPCLPVPQHLVDYSKKRLAERRELYVLRLGGLPDKVVFEGQEYRLWARSPEDQPIGLYSYFGASVKSEDCWLLRDREGTLSLSGRPQAPDKHGVPRRYLKPHCPKGHWMWVRSQPVAS